MWRLLFNVCKELPVLGGRCELGAPRSPIEERCHIATCHLLIGAIGPRSVCSHPSFGNAGVCHPPDVLGMGRFVGHVVEPVWTTSREWIPLCIERHVVVGVISIEVPRSRELFVRIPASKNAVFSRERCGFHVFDEGFVVFPVDGDGLDGRSTVCVERYGYRWTYDCERHVNKAAEAPMPDTVTVALPMWSFLWYSSS